MATEDFQKHVAGLTVKRLEKPKNLKDQCQKYWDEILAYQYNFNRGEGGREEGEVMTSCCGNYCLFSDEAEIACLRTITQEDLIKFFDVRLYVVCVCVC